jgi:hypothetical protein
MTKKQRRSTIVQEIMADSKIKVFTLWFDFICGLGASSLCHWLIFSAHTG